MTEERVAPEPQITRPKPIARWGVEWYDGPTGSATHRVHLGVTALFVARRPEASGAPNEIRVDHMVGDRTESFRLNREGAYHLLACLSAALDWSDETPDQPVGGRDAD